MNDAQKTRDRLSAVFRRKGGSGRYLRLFTDLEQGQQNTLLEAGSLEESELAILGGILEPDEWLVLTDKKLLWKHDGEVNVVPVRTILDAVVDFRALQASARAKSRLTEIQLKTVHGAVHKIHVEEGAPLSGLWNVLRSIAARNRATSTPGS